MLSTFSGSGKGGYEDFNKILGLDKALGCPTLLAYPQKKRRPAIVFRDRLAIYDNVASTGFSILRIS